MKTEIIELQNRAVNELLQKIDNSKELTFRAPTGSGKTFMMAKFMDEVLHRDKDVIFLVSTLSKGNLAKQNNEKFIDYVNVGYLKNLKPYLINTIISGEERLYIPTYYNVYSLPRDLYKKGGRLMQGSMESFLQELTTGIMLEDGALTLGMRKKIYLIRDESHQETNNLNTLSDKYFTKIINFSATPKLQKKQQIDVQITDKEAESIGLIKKVKPGNTADTFEDAIKIFKTIRNKYNELLQVHPCMIVQISNKDKANDEWLKIIKPALEKNQDLKWMLIVDKQKDCDTNDPLKKQRNIQKWKDYVKENQDTTDIIIFKLAISEGWDIPRACMLYQIRDTDSKQLDEQVMGRVRRNPRLTDFETLSKDAQDLATTAWIWGVIPKPENNVYEVELYHKDIQDKIQIKTTRLKPLKDKLDFNIKTFVDSIQNTIVSNDIFSLYNKYSNSNNIIKSFEKEYVKSYQDWFKYCDNIDRIKKECDNYYCDYEKSMILNVDSKNIAITSTIQRKSFYTDTLEKLDINNWIWIKKDDSETFAFDSEAEMKWATLLMQLCSENISNNSQSRVIKEFSDIADFNRYLWGKNYLDNSDIKYEYYLNGYHFSYPDFILKDAFERIHIFEVKSVNHSSNNTIDEQEYNRKVEELKKCYLQASKLTGHIFYLPVLKGLDWSIFQYINGQCNILDKSQFIRDIKQG